MNKLTALALFATLFTTGCEPKADTPWLADITLEAGKAGAPRVPHYRIDSRVVLPGIRVLAAPMIFAVPGIPSSIVGIKSTSFIQDMDIEVQGSEFIADPVIGVLQTGIRIEVVAAPRDATHSTLAFRLTTPTLDGAVRSKTVHFGRDANPATVQLPHLITSQWSGAIQVRHGRDTLLTEFEGPNGVGRAQVFVTVTSTGSLTTPKLPVGADPKVPEDALRSMSAMVPDRPLPYVLRDAHAQSQGEQVHVEFVQIHASPPRFVPMLEPQAKALLALGSSSLATFTLSSTNTPGVGARRGTMKSYVQDYDPAGPTEEKKTANGTVVKSKMGLYDPVIGTVEDGIAAHIVSHEQQTQLQLVWSQLKTPIETFKAQLDPKLTVEIDLPELRMVSVRIDLATGQCHLNHGSVDAPKLAKPVDFRSGRVLIPFGKMLTKDEEARTLAAWIRIAKASTK